MCDGVYTFREKYRMAAIYSELLEDYFLTNINSDLFGDDGTKDDVEEDTTTVGNTNVIVIIHLIVPQLELIAATDFVFSASEGLPVDRLVIEHSQATSVDLVGLQVWRGALLLADFILARPDLVRDRRVLELAAGTGVTSVTAGMFASAVTATDVDRGEATEGDDKQSHVLISCRRYSTTFEKEQMS